jgi:mono/diheme cytochrome c family protein
MKASALLAMFVVLAFPAAAQQAGEAEFGKRCARCHDTAAAVAFLKSHPDAKERAVWLDRKLARHHARDAAERKAIIGYLESALGATK